MKRFFLLIYIGTLLLQSNELSGQEIFDSTIVLCHQTIYFASGKHKLNNENQILLDNFIDKSFRKKGSKYFIDAHTDDVGSVNSNSSLSQRRKQSVKKYITKKSIPDSFIVARHHGEEKLSNHKRDQISRQLNRRVVVQSIINKDFIRVSGQISDHDNKNGIDGFVEIKTVDFEYSVQTDKKGLFKIVLPVNEIVILNYHAKNYFFESKVIRVLPNILLNKVTLKKANLGSKIILDNMNFMPDRNILIPRSKTSLNNLIKFIEINEDVCIEICGHVNSYGGPHYTNHDLSKARALIILEKLKNKGINKDRILAKGYGDLFKLYFKPETFYEQEANRRVEIIIVSCDSILKIPNDTLVNPKYYSNIVIDRKFNKQDFSNHIRYFHHIHRSEILYKLKQLKKENFDPTQFSYQELLVAGQELKYENNEIASKLRSIYKTDQDLRSKSKVVEKRYGLHSKELENHWLKINNQDSINLLEVKSILDEFGWLSPDEISEDGNAALFLVIQHSNLKDQIKYLPMLREAVKNGKANGQDLALLEDRVALGQGKKQVYGSQVHRNNETSEYYVAPLEKPNSVNERRNKIGLIPMEEYLLHWNMDWKIELGKLNGQ